MSPPICRVSRSRRVAVAVLVLLACVAAPTWRADASDQSGTAVDLQRLRTVIGWLPADSTTITVARSLELPI